MRRELRSGGIHHTFSSMDSDILWELHKESPKILATQEFPANCMGLDKQFDHMIKLKDKSKLSS